MGRKLLIVAGTLALALIIIVWQRNISAQSDLQSLACEPGLTTWLSGTSPAHTPVLIYWDGRAVGGGSSDGSGHWALPLTVGHERPGVYMVEVRARGSRALIGAFQCAVGGNIPTSAPLILQPTLVPTAEPIPTASIATMTPEPTVELVPTESLGPTVATLPTLSAENPLSTGGQDRYDCSDFEDWSTAYAVFEANQPGDPNKLDDDGDDIPCEMLPGAPTS